MKFADMILTVMLTQLSEAVLYLARSDANKIKFGDAGGCEVMVSVLRTHGTSNAAVALQACWAITNLSFNVENKRRLVAADARTVVASCAENSMKADALNRLKTSWWSW